MKHLFASLFVLFSFFSFAQQLEVSEIRTQLEEAMKSKSTAEKLVETLGKEGYTDATRTALTAQAQGVLCLHTKNPQKLIKYSKQASEYANKAVSFDANNIEARFARFAIGSQAPKILGLSKNLKDDVNFLTKNFTASNLKGIPYVVKEDMINVMNDSGEFTTSQIITFKKALN